MVKNMEMVYISIKMEICMMVSGSLIEKMVREYFTMILISPYMKVVGEKMKKKALVYKNMMMDPFMKGTGRRVLEKAEVFIVFQMEQNLMESGKMIWLMVREQ